MDAHLAHFGLSERPFEIVTDPRFFYASREHNEALARLTYLVDQQSMYFGMLTGEIGSGKSITRKVFSAEIDWQRHYVFEFENSGFTFAELIARLLVRSGFSPADADPSAGLARLFDMVANLATELQRVQHRQLVLLFDEAQDLDDENLLHLKRLSNLNGEIEGRISIVLIGQPELRPRVAALPALDQRISLRFHLPNLPPDEVPSYLASRLRVAGHPDGRLFDEEAAAELHRASRGVPREINRLAKLSIEAAAAERRPRLDAGIVRMVVSDLRRHQSAPPALALRP